MLVRDAIDDLNAYRLEQDLSYARLAGAMKAAGYPVKVAALYLLLTRQTDTPRETTRYKIDRFLALVARQKKSRRSYVFPRRST